MRRRGGPAEYATLARVRRSLRALNAAIGRGAEAAGLTLQQQGFLLAMAAYGGSGIPLADVREELEMDQATATELLKRLVRARLVARATASDRRAINVRLTLIGWQTFRRSVTTIRAEIQRAEHRGELSGLRQELRAYLGFYLRDAKTSREGRRSSG
jgi:DNA-binding MarR family transcriptional regulator